MSNEDMNQVNQYHHNKENLWQDAKEESNRGSGIVRVSIIGIVANVLLAVFKAFVGTVSGSIAIIMDAVNNLTDATSSLITIIGTKLGSRRPDRKHPFGQGRMEYLSALVIALLVLYAGVTSFIESVKKIIHPEKPEYTAVSLVIITVAVFVKIWLGLYTKKSGERLHSESLVNSGSDAQFDAIISASTLVAAIIFLFSGISLEAWLGAIIAVVIIKSGLEMLSSAISKILGQSASVDLIQQIKKYVQSFDGVEGAYDLVLNDFGPEAYNGSIHIAVNNTMTVNELDELSREITSSVYHKFHVILTGIGVYAIETKDPEIIAMRDQIEKIVMADPHVKQMHGFHVDKKRKSIRFDVVISFDAPNDEHYKIISSVQKAFPDYQVDSALDLDLSGI